MEAVNRGPSCMCNKRESTFHACTSQHATASLLPASGVYAGGVYAAAARQLG